MYSKTKSEEVRKVVDKMANERKYGVNAFLPLGIDVPTAKDFVLHFLGLAPWPFPRMDCTKTRSCSVSIAVLLRTMMLENKKMSDARNCALCNRTPTDGVQMGNAGTHSSLWIMCPLCGRYELIGPFAATHNIRWSKEVRQALSCATRQASESGHTLKISSLSDAEDLARPHLNTRVVDNQERLLREMAKRAQRPDAAASFNPATWTSP